MLVINYNGNKPTTDYFKYSVQGNNDVDVIRFIIQLSSSNASSVFGKNYYAKVRCDDDGFVDKVPLSKTSEDVENGLMYAEFSLEAKHTQHKQIAVSFCAEFVGTRKTTVWQTQEVKITINGGIDADEEIENTYPTIIQDYGRRITALEEGGGGGSGGSPKKIVLEVLPSFRENGITYRSSLRLHLVGFNESDIGSSIYLYRYSNAKHSKRYYDEDDDTHYLVTRAMKFRHPRNWNDENHRNVAHLGYSVLALQKVEVDGTYYQYSAIDGFMIHNGSVQTEYEITASDIENGYLDIEYSVEYLSLISPSTRDPQNKVNGKIMFRHYGHMIGNKQYITYMQVKDGEITAYPTNMISLSFQSNVEIYGELIGYRDTDDMWRFTQELKVKLLPF